MITSTTTLSTQLNNTSLSKVSECSRSQEPNSNPEPQEVPQNLSIILVVKVLDSLTLVIMVKV